jgi:hypothetical protein
MVLFGAFTWCYVPQRCYKSRNDYGFSVQVSGVRKIQRTACDESFDPELTAEGLSRVEDYRQTESVSGHLTSAICYLTPETQNRTVFCKLLAECNNSTGSRII